MTTFEEFETRARASKSVQLADTLLADTLTPVSTYLALRQQGIPSFLFESVEPNERIGRFSFVGAGPEALLRARGHDVIIRKNGSETVYQGSVFEALAEMSRSYGIPGGEGAEGLAGGLVGYLGYNTVRSLESVDIPDPGPRDEDDAVFGLFPTAVRFDHRAQLVNIVHNVLLDNSVPLKEQYDRGRQTVETVGLRLRRSVGSSGVFSCMPDATSPGWGFEEFCDSVERAKQLIVDGEIFQVVLSRRTQLTFSGDLFSVYRALRMINPSPYLFYLDFGDTKLAGSSPEVLVRSRGNQVELLPIAGTRRRGRNETEDRALEEQLARDEKELAEHVMLVDLGRNDIGRICRYGTVQVPVFKRVERYSHVMHLVSVVTGRKLDDLSPVDVLKACFPAGTVSGAPKIRAMEIIQGLEKTPRGAYAGAVGYVGFDGTLDTCIAIRTIVAHDTLLKVQAGAGIVADSIPEREFEETENKAHALMEALDAACKGLPADRLLKNTLTAAS
jgi:anthranilate synthase component 1